MISSVACVAPNESQDGKADGSIEDKNVGERITDESKEERVQLAVEKAGLVVKTNKVEEDKMQAEIAEVEHVTEDKKSCSGKIADELERTTKENKFDGHLTEGSEAGKEQTIAFEKLLKADNNQDWTFQEIKMYGRKSEVSLLKETWEHILLGGKEIFLVSGQSGTGKSTLVKEGLEKAILDTSAGFFLSGKYDLLQGREPYLGINLAFADLCNQINGLDDINVTKYRAAISEAVGSEGRVITDIIPQLKSIIGEQDEVEELEGNEAKNRVTTIFRRFLHSIVEIAPVALFQDDLQWVDEASMELIQAMVTDKQVKSFLFIGAYRDEEVHETHSLKKSIIEFKRVDIPMKQLEIKNLSEEVVQNIISESLSLSPDKVKSLSDYVVDLTRGNAFFVVRMLDHLRHGDFIKFSSTSGQWEWDMKEIMSQKFSNDVIDLFVIQMNKLDPLALRILTMASGIGSYFDTFTIDLLAKSGILDHDHKLRQKMLLYRGSKPLLSILVSQGFILESGKQGYKFYHDKIRQAAYSMIEREDREMFHLKFGRVLVKKATPKLRSSFSSMDSGHGLMSSTRLRIIGNLSSCDMQNFMERQLFVAVDQLNMGRHLIPSKEERLAVIELNLRAATLAYKSSAFRPTEGYLSIAFSMLDGDYWEENYDLALRLFNLFAEIKYCLGDINELKDMVDCILGHAKSFNDGYDAHVCRLKAYVLEIRQRDAIEEGLSILKGLEEPLPKKPSMISVIRNILKIKRMLKGKTHEKFLKLPKMNDERIRKVMDTLNLLIPSTYNLGSLYLPLIICKMVELTMLYGTCHLTSFAFVMYGIMQVPSKKTEEAYNFGEIGMKFEDKQEIKKYIPEVHGVFYALISCWKDPLQSLFDPLCNCFQVALETGNMDWAIYPLMININHQLHSGENIDTIITYARTSFDQIPNLHLQQIRCQMTPFFQAVLNLSGQSPDPTRLTGEAMNEDEILKTVINEKNEALELFIRIPAAYVAYTFGDYERAMIHLKKTKHAEKVISGNYNIVIQAFYDALTSFELARQNNNKMRKSWIEKGSKIIKRFKKWSEVNPHNNLHKLLLLKAERAKMKCNKSIEKQEVVLKMYEDAMQRAKKAGFVNEEALSHERAALFCKQIGNDILFKKYFSTSVKLYHQWGAIGKVDQLVKQLKVLHLDLNETINTSDE